MFIWNYHLQWKRSLIAGAIFLIIATVVRQIEVIFTMNYYQKPEYFGVWSKLMMPAAGPPPMSFLLTSLWFSFLTGVTLAIFYEMVKGALPKDRWPKIIRFTEMVVGLSFVFFTLPLYLMVNLPIGLLVSWFISSFIIFFLNSIVLVKLYR